MKTPVQGLWLKLQKPAGCIVHGPKWPSDLCRGSSGEVQVKNLKGGELTAISPLWGRRNVVRDSVRTAT
jgi:hypothetical protein